MREVLGYNSRLTIFYQEFNRKLCFNLNSNGNNLSFKQVRFPIIHLDSISKDFLRLL